MSGEQGGGGPSGGNPYAGRARAIGRRVIQWRRVGKQRYGIQECPTPGCDKRISAGKRSCLACAQGENAPPGAAPRRRMRLP